MSHDDQHDVPRDHLFRWRDLVCFGDAHPVAAIDPDGETHFWLIDPDHQHIHPACCGRHTPAHEELGPLPRDVRLRIGQCSALGKTTGHRCRNPVRPPATRCWHHEGAH